jgi:AcrR family transcriptional regulator
MKSYHHGDLRKVLLAAAIELIAGAGPGGFTLREVARRAGVSHNAPYRHFKSKEDLMATVATQGFRELNRTLLAAIETRTGAKNRLKACGLAYVAFALRRPEHFAVMFDAPVSGRRNRERTEAAEAAFGTLLKTVADVMAAERKTSVDPLDHALFAWSLVHGIAKLAIAGRFPYRSKAGVLKFTEAAIREFL